MKEAFDKKFTKRGHHPFSCVLKIRVSKRGSLFVRDLPLNTLLPMIDRKVMLHMPKSLKYDHIYQIMVSTNASCSEVYQTNMPALQKVSPSVVLLYTHSGSFHSITAMKSRLKNHESHRPRTPGHQCPCKMLLSAPGCSRRCCLVCSLTFKNAHQIFVLVQNVGKV